MSGIPVVLGGVPISIPHSCSQERLQRLLAPRVTERGIVIPSLMRTDNPFVTKVLVNNNRMVAIEYLMGAGTRAIYPSEKVLLAVGISAKVNGQWTPRVWDNLLDNDRFTIRNALGQRYRTSGMGYRDENSAYYVLEGLEQS